MKTLDKNHICFAQIAFAATTPKGFSDVSILTGGEAGGHGIIVDEQTIVQFIALTMGKTIPAYLTHEDADEDRLGDEIGMFSGFYRDGMKVRAQNFVFLQAFIDNEVEEYQTLVELAKTYPDQLGISPVIRYYCVWCLPGGAEVDTSTIMTMPDNAINAMPSVRLLSVKSCDFVKQPAANVGLFSANGNPLVDGKTTNNPKLMSADTILLAEHTKALTAKDGEIATLSIQHKDALAALETKHTTEITTLTTNLTTTHAQAIAGLEAKHKSELTALEAKHSDLIAKLAVKDEEAGKLTVALAAKAKEAEDAARYDMRKAGAPALETALLAHGNLSLPAPAATDNAKWAQYTELEAKDPMLAARFKEKYLARK
jgi:hypothetical protein